MKSVAFAMLAVISAGAGAAQQYPGCAISQQHDLVAPTGGRIADPRQAHVSMRVNIVQADIGSARKARRLSQAQADRLWQRADRVRRDSDRFVATQGFLSAAERASYDRELDAIAMSYCR